ncbi:hypothetical protein JCM12296A_57310 [Desulfosarcina cetonica]
MNRGKRGQLPVTQTMQPVMPKRQLAVAALYTRTGTLKQSRAFLRNAFNNHSFIFTKPCKRGIATI